MHHYITKYSIDGIRYAESWFQVNLLGKCYCFWNKKITLDN